MRTDQLRKLSTQRPLMLPFGEGSPEQRIDCLDDLLGPAGLEVDFATANAHPRLESGELDLDPFFFKLLSNGLSSHLAATFGAL